MKNMMPEVVDRKLEGKPIPPEEFLRFGISSDKVYAHVKNLTDLREQGHSMVIAECKRTSEFVQNKFKTQRLIKNNKYVMSLSVYRQLHFNTYLKDKILRPSGIKFEKIYRPYTGQDLTNKKLLVWRTGGLGDLLFIQPNLIHLKEKYPSSTIYFSCGPQYHPMVENWDCIDKLVELPFNFLHMVQSDYHVTFEGVIERCDLAQTTNAYRLFTDWMGLYLPDEKLKPRQTPKKECLEKAKGALWAWGLENKPFILAQLRASSPIRTPRPSVWGKIINMLAKENYKIIITDNKHFEKGINEFIGTFIDENVRKNVFNFSQFSDAIDSTIALSSLSSLVLSIDSALVHIAASLDIPSLTLYGPFPSNVRVSTYGDKAQVIECNKVPCAPCFTHGVSPCKNSTDQHGICFDMIDNNEILEKVKKVI